MASSFLHLLLVVVVEVVVVVVKMLGSTFQNFPVHVDAMTIHDYWWRLLFEESELVFPKLISEGMIASCAFH